jgi:hypothetical protein
LNIGSRFIKDKDDCCGKIKYSDGKVIVFCSGCDGGSELSNRRCFKGLGERIVPGLLGEIILSGEEEKGYSGPVVEALDSYSEITGLFDILIERSNHKILKEARNEYMKDPMIFSGNYKRFIKKLKNSKNGVEILPVFEEIKERNDLMIRKLKKHL